MTYEAYIASASWASKRAARLALDGQRCRLCDEDGSRYALEVHHRPSSYSRIPNECIERDLITVCARCHEFITASIRADRYGQRPLPDVALIDAPVQVREDIRHGLADLEVQVEVLGWSIPPRWTSGLRLPVNRLASATGARNMGDSSLSDSKHGPVGSGQARRGRVWHGAARWGEARRVLVRRGRTGPGAARRVAARLGEARQGLVWPGKVTLGRHGEVRQGKAARFRVIPGAGSK